MNKIEARAQLDKFLDGGKLTFSFEHFRNGEWVATCDQIPGIVTGGMNEDITSTDMLLRSAIVSAAGLPIEHADVLRFEGLRQNEPSIVSRITNRRSESDFARNEQARYVLV